MNSESEIKYQAMENHYKSIISQLQDEIKELKLKLAEKCTDEHDSNYEGTLRMRALESIKN